MVIKVLIERWAREGYEDMVWHMVREMRAEAVRTRGYLYGETWRSVENPRILMILSVWSSEEHWHSWDQSEFRRKVEERMSRMLRKATTVRIFTDAIEPLPQQPAFQNKRTPRRQA